MKKSRLARWFRRLLQPYDTPSIGMGRRQLITAGLLGLTGGLLLRSQPAGGETAYTGALVRPPGALPEADFLQKCIRCSACMKACPTNVLQPTLLESGLAGMWSPVLRTRLSYCEYKCQVCSQVCPTEAIRKVTLAEKQQLKIGLAAVDPVRCLPIAYGKVCTVCRDICPVTDKAIWLEDVTVTLASGQTVWVGQPLVDSELCIGCGACEAECPVSGEAAIRVTGIPRSG